MSTHYSSLRRLISEAIKAASLDVIEPLNTVDSRFLTMKSLAGELRDKAQAARQEINRLNLLLESATGRIEAVTKKIHFGVRTWRLHSRLTKTLARRLLTMKDEDAGAELTPTRDFEKFITAYKLKQADNILERIDRFGVKTMAKFGELQAERKKLVTEYEAACAAKQECADEARDLEQRVEAMTDSLRRNWSMKGVSE